MNYKVAVVEWCDAWFSDSLSSDVNLVRHTVGWLVQNNKRVIRLALTYDDRGPADLMNIPRAYVRKIRVLDTRGLRDETDEDLTEPSEKDMLEAAKGY